MHHLMASVILLDALFLVTALFPSFFFDLRCKTATTLSGSVSRNQDALCVCGSGGCGMYAARCMRRSVRTERGVRWKALLKKTGEGLPWRMGRCPKKFWGRCEGGMDRMWGAPGGSLGGTARFGAGGAGGVDLAR